MAKKKALPADDGDVIPELQSLVSDDENACLARLCAVAIKAETVYDAKFQDSRSWGKGGLLDMVVAHAVTARAHSWCVEVHGSWRSLVAAGFAYDGWKKDFCGGRPLGACGGIRFAGRNIEVSRLAGDDDVDIEVSYGLLPIPKRRRKPPERDGAGDAPA